jgi:3-oxoacid CoA-transferase subunit A
MSNLEINKVVESLEAAVADIQSGSSIAVGGFGLCGIPQALIRALQAQGAKALTIVSNNCGVEDWGLGLLLSSRRIQKIIASYVGENKEFERQYLAGEVDVVLTPQGTLAEKLRAGGAGIPGFYTPAGVGTMIEKGGIPIRYNSDGSVAKASEPKETRTFENRDYLLEEAITTDFALVRATIGDRLGNLVYDASARNFNPLVASAGRITIAEVEQLVEPGVIKPEDVHTQGIFVQRVVLLTPEQVAEKRIERLTVNEEG